jgi:hypothetical protein
MSKRFKYGVPLLVDLRAESATAATCDAFGDGRAASNLHRPRERRLDRQRPPRVAGGRRQRGIRVRAQTGVRFGEHAGLADPLLSDGLAGGRRLPILAWISTEQN